ncbi:MAG: DUF4142 domain-containing protein [Acidobacteria bacterium]|nr:DUF4142 domain-containing protein [Acidobacteriota bacterium]
MRTRASFTAALLAAAGMALWLGPGAAAQNTGSMSANANSTGQNVSSTDAKFLRKAAQDDKAEIDLAKMAQQRASSPAVKQFAQQLEQGHTAALHKTKQVAASEGVALPSKPGKGENKEAERLSKLSGPEFDRAFVQYQMSAHRKDIAAFQYEAANGQNPQIKQFAANSVPGLEHHLMLAEQTASAIGVSTTGTAANAAAPK